MRTTSGSERRSWLAVRRERRSARTSLGIPSHERIIAACRDARGRPVVATTAGCAWQGEEHVHRVPWSAVFQARWATPILTLRLEEAVSPVTDSGEPPRARTVITEVQLTLDNPGGLPDAVHACVTESVVFSERIDIDGAAVLLIARRGSARPIASAGAPLPAEVHWTIAFEDDAQAADPVIVTRAEAALREIRIALGI